MLVPGPGSLISRTPARLIQIQTRQGLSRSQVILMFICPALRPRLDLAIRHYDGSVLLPYWRRRKLPAISHISRLYHAAFELAVYASRLRVTLRACKTRFRLPAKLCRVGFAYPQDSCKRFQSVSSRPPFLSTVTQRQGWRANT